ncbi:CorA metal ion transporter [Saitoella coloradoensis]
MHHHRGSESQSSHSSFASDSRSISPGSPEAARPDIGPLQGAGQPENNRVATSPGPQGTPNFSPSSYTRGERYGSKSYFTERKRRGSNDSIDSDVLLDHRNQAQSLPRNSFMMPRASVAGGGHRGSRVWIAPKDPNNPPIDGEPVSEASDSEGSSEEDKDENSSLLRKGSQAGRQHRPSLTKRTSSTRHRHRSQRSRMAPISEDHVSHRDGYGTMPGTASSSPTDRKSINNPSSVPSSYASPPPSQRRPTAGRPSVSGINLSGQRIQLPIAQRALPGEDLPPSGVDMGSLPHALSSGTPSEAGDGRLYDDPTDTHSDAGDRPWEGEDNRNRSQSKAEEDVCFPVEDTTTGEAMYSWPNYDVLDDWTREEKPEYGSGDEESRSRSPSRVRVRRLSEPAAVEGRLRFRGQWSGNPKPEEERPWRFTFFSESVGGTVHSPSMSDILREDERWEDVLGKDTGLWWLDVNQPTDSEMKMLSKAFGIHPLTTEDISMEETREKVELFRNYYLVSFRSFEQDPASEDYLEPVNMYIVVFRDAVISFHFTPTPHPANVRRRIRHLSDYITVSSDWISYALIDDITDAFAPLIHRIEYEVDAIDDVVLKMHSGSDDSDSEDEGENGGNMLRRIGECRKKVMGLLRLLGSKADVIKGFAKRCNEQWDVAPRSEIGLYLGDIQDHIVTMTQNLNHYEKMLSRSHSNYLAQISINMTRVNNETNDVLSRLTVLGTILVPLNLVTGLWGMNVEVPGQNHSGLSWFFGILSSLAAFAIFSTIMARRYGVV